MAFESLSERITDIFKNLRKKGKLTTEDIKSTLREVRLAFLEADVNYKVAKEFISNVTEQATSSKVLEGLNPSQTIIKIVNDELTNIMGKTKKEINLKENELNKWLIVGLQGSGKTTSAVKLAKKYKENNKKVLLVAADIYRPAAIDQLKINAKKADVEVFDMGTDVAVVDIIKNANEYALSNNFDIMIIDSAGRLQVDNDLMNELKEIKSLVDIDETLLVLDATTGQEAVNITSTFNDEIEITGAILTKLDSDTRGGAALSLTHITNVPIYYIGQGEKLDDLDSFYPDRMASRILGMGDVLSLIEKAEKQIDEKKAKELDEKIKKAEFDFNDYLDAMSQMEKMGGISNILKMMPTMGVNLKDINDIDSNKGLSKAKNIIYSMTPKERSNPDILNTSRKLRIARGAGVDIAEVNKLVKGFKNVSKYMKNMKSMTNNKVFRGKFNFPFK